MAPLRRALNGCPVCLEGPSGAAGQRDGVDGRNVWLDTDAVEAMVRWPEVGREALFVRGGGPEMFMVGLHRWMLRRALEASGVGGVLEIQRPEGLCESCAQRWSDLWWRLGDAERWSGVERTRLWAEAVVDAWFVRNWGPRLVEGLRVTAAAIERGDVPAARGVEWLRELVSAAGLDKVAAMRREMWLASLPAAPAALPERAGVSLFGKAIAAGAQGARA